MRFEINIPDTTGPELQAMFVALTRRLSERPELVAEIALGEDETIQRMFTPERLAHIDQALSEVKAGRGYTAEQVEEHFAQKETSWTQSHQH